MRSRAAASLVIVIVTLVAAAFLWPRWEAPAQQPVQKSWSHIQVIAYASGLTGFFDTRTGRLYVYDANLDQPAIIREIDELGKSLKRIRN
jgi:hypothetical protein